VWTPVRLTLPVVRQLRERTSMLLRGEIHSFVVVGWLPHANGDERLACVRVSAWRQSGRVVGCIARCKLVDIICNGTFLPNELDAPVRLALVV